MVTFTEEIHNGKLHFLCSDRIIRFIFYLGHASNFKGPFDGTTTSIGDIGSAFYGGLWAYDGWNNLNYCIEELKNPFKDLPRSIMIGIPLVTILYVSINVAYLTVLSPNEINTELAVAVVSACELTKYTLKLREIFLPMVFISKTFPKVFLLKLAFEKHFRKTKSLYLIIIFLLN